jgi:inner membrane protein
MIGRTHDLAGMTTLTLLVAYLPTLPPMTMATAITAFGANFLGSLFPDIDQPTSDLWDNFRGGPLVSKFVCRFLGGHRHISHSIVGVILIGAVSAYVLKAISGIVLLDMQIIWIAFMVGVLSHIVFDMPTKEGVPLFWPMMTMIGIPPIRHLRIRSGHWVENLLIFPGLLLLNGYLIYSHYGKFIEFFHSLRK